MVKTDAQVKIESSIVACEKTKKGLGKNPASNADIKALNDLKSLVFGILNTFLNEADKLLSKFYYAIDSEDYKKIAQSRAALYVENDNLEALKEFLSQYEKIKAVLKEKEITAEELDKNAKHEDKKSNKSLENAASLVKDLDVLEGKLKKAENQEEYNEILAAIDKKLKKLNSLNRRIAKLKSKNGIIGNRQRSLSIRTSKIKNARNTSIVERDFNGSEITDKIDTLKAAYEAENKAKTPTEIVAARKAVREAERSLYGRKINARSSKKIEDALKRRKELIKKIELDETEYKNNREYQKAFKEAIKELKRLDKQIMGRSNTNHLYEGLKEKSGYLVGGTAIVLPAKLTSLTQDMSEKLK